MVRRNDFYVYMYFAPSGLPIYVGKGRRNRWTEHLKQAILGRDGSNPYFMRVIRKILKKGETPTILKLLVNVSEDHAFEFERELINFIGRRNSGGSLLNLTDGGEGISGWKLTPMHKQALLLAILGKPLSVEHRSKIGEANSRRIWKQSSRDKIGTSRRGIKLTAEQKRALFEGCSVYWKGRKRSPENRLQISKTLTGRKASAATREKMSAARNGVSKTQKFKDALKASWARRKAAGL